MKKYNAPEIEFELFEIDDVITVSITGIPSDEGENEGPYLNDWN